MNILNYVTEYLGSKTEVIVPKMGRFYILQREARLQEQKGRIIPPTKEVAFQQDKRLDDPSLYLFIQQKINKPLPEVQEWVKQQVDHLYLEVNNQKILYSPIGIFTPDENDGIKLKESFPLEHQHEFFGLEPISIQPSPTPTTEQKQKQNLNHKKNTRLYWILFFFIPIIALAIAGYYYKEAFFGKKSFIYGLPLHKENLKTPQTEPTKPDNLSPDTLNIHTDTLNVTPIPQINGITSPEQTAPHK